MVTVLAYIDDSIIAVRLSQKGLIIGPLWFSYIYCLMRMIKEKNILEKIDCSLSLLGWGMTYLIMFVISLVFQNAHIRDLVSPLCLISALFMFNFIRHLNVKQNAKINFIASTTYGIYLFQVHLCFSSYIWLGLFNLKVLSEVSCLYGIVGILAAAFIIICAIMIDSMRQLMNITLRKVKNIIVVNNTCYVEICREREKVQ